MDNLKFSVFTFPQNPSGFAIDAVRAPQYTVAEDGTVSYGGLGPLCRTVRCSGVFTGVYAHENFNALAVLMAAGQVGALVHPQWGTITAYLTGLSMEQDSREEYVAYSIEFREADESGMIPKLPEETE